ncbi:hypothetical protein [Desulforhopalus singaporensis]|uniref:Uncharacterized protein n=1 Tax=Desulforhopalus singaporensis TaxID=91360 RepID=A0A1H0M0D6_9BACT|nr:hypothetical protein [Desulforhopalus singaporensis]SDO73845.1 hypothetical protein SAMN05660330_00930 [Desulforhopalus singaporensis]
MAIFNRNNPQKGSGRMRGMCRRTGELPIKGVGSGRMKGGQKSRQNRDEDYGENRNQQKRMVRERARIFQREDKDGPEDLEELKRLYQDTQARLEALGERIAYLEGGK